MKVCGIKKDNLIQRKRILLYKKDITATLIKKWTNILAHVDEYRSRMVPEDI